MVKSFLYTASAGAGKTYRLTEEVFHRIQEPERFVAAITFTRAAAAEMERRILSEIIAGENAPSEPAERLALIMRAAKVHFSTIDALFHLFLSTESYVPQIADDLEKRVIETRVTSRFFRDPALRGNIARFIMVARILEKDPGDVLGVLEEEQEKLLGWECSREQLDQWREKQEKLKNTFASYQREVADIAPQTEGNLRNHVVNNLLKTLESQPQGELFKKESLEEVRVAAQDRKSEAYKKLKKIYPEMRALVAEYLMNTQRLRAALLRQFAEVYRNAVNVEKDLARRIFFDDVAQNLAALDPEIGEGGERPALMARLYELGFHGVSDLFLDEFQDTSRIQLELLRPLMEEILSRVDDKAEGERSLLFVGDWKQSIYRWRNADPTALREWVAPYEAKGQIEKMPLLCNWRSTPLLIGFFNNLVRRLFAGTEMESDRQEPPPPEKRKRGYGGISEVRVIPVVKEDRSDDALYARLVEEIKLLQKRHGCAYGDITILCRTHRHIEKVTGALAAEEILTSSIRGRAVLSMREGMGLYLALLRVFRTDTVSDAYLEEALRRLGYEETVLPLVTRLSEEVVNLPGPHRFAVLSQALSRLEPFFPRIVVETVWQWGEAYFSYREAGDILSFLIDWIARSQEITVPEPEHSDRVKISTIHGVKGLEFPHVVLFWKEESEKSVVMLHPTEHFPLSLSRDKREFLELNPVDGARAFAQPHEEVREERREETANLLYVAATRAKQSLSIVMSAKRSGELEGFSATLRDAAADGIDLRIEPHAHQIEEADNDRVTGWFCDYGEQVADAKKGREFVRQPLDFSQEGSKEEEKEEIDPVYLSAQIEEAAARGIRIHRALATITPEGNFLEKELATAQEGVVVRRFLSLPPVREILFRPGVVRVEQHLSDKEDFGIVDRLIVAPDKVTLVDYKTGYRNEVLRKKYREQMEKYRKMLTALFPDRPTEAYLLFVDDERNPVEAI